MSQNGVMEQWGEEPQASSGAILGVETSRAVLQGTPVAFTCSPSYTGSSKALSAADKHWGQRDREPLAWAIAELSGDKGLSWSCSLLLLFLPGHHLCP